MQFLLSSILFWAISTLAAGFAPSALDTPDLTPYDPVDVLCTLGKESGGARKISPWCKDWLQCIKSKANPEGTPEAVMKAWSPADCKEFCGVWPVMTPAEGAKKSAVPSGLQKKSFMQSSNATAPIGLINMNSKADCLKSCGNFQSSLSNCVATIMFEPGKVAAMGIPKKGGPAPAEICTKKDTPCMPDLAVNHQKCLGHKTKSVLDRSYKIPDEVSQSCKFMKLNMEDCKKCPQLQDKYQSQYATFTGGCMDQLNAYWQATHPEAGKTAIPGATGCTVH
jgi:hypothetical protein